MSNNSYRFYKNNACEYFPCHKTENTEEFNCMFCYCPLYFAEDCGGNSSCHEGIKDCSNCMIPHLKGGYDYINQKIVEINKKKREAASK